LTKVLRAFTYIHIHPLLWIVIAVAVATAHFIELSLLLLIIFIHEMGHAVAASFFSWRIKKISLLPFGGVAEMDEHGNRPLKEEAIVVLAGPMQHAWLIGVAFLLFQFGIMSASLYTLFIQYNIMILLFNFLPIWPLDGGKLVFLWLSLKQPFPVAHKRTLWISLVAVILFGILTLVTSPINLNIWIIISFLGFTLYHEWKQGRYIFIRFLLERYYGNSTELRDLKPIKVQEDELVIHVLEQFQRGCKHPIVVLEQEKEKGMLDENELLHAYFSERLLTAKIRDLLYIY
jgi:stage IV sporulation protein FB